MKPDPSQYNPDPQYLRDLLSNAKVSQCGVADTIGISERTFRDYLKVNHSSQAPYTVQFALECLATD